MLFSGPSSRDTRGKRKRSSASAYSSPSPIRPESKQGSLQRKRQKEMTEEDNQDEERSWVERELMRNRDRGGGGDVNGELDLGIDRLLSDQRGGMPRSPNASRDRVSRSQSGSRDRASRERHPSSGRNAGNISDGFEIPGLGRGEFHQTRDKH